MTTRFLSASGLSDDELVVAEKLWTAYLLTTARDPMVASENVGDASATYANMKVNPYGHALMELDISGVVAQLATSSVAGDIAAFGPYTEAEDAT
jgi:hypothetical protein